VIIHCPLCLVTIQVRRPLRFGASLPSRVLAPVICQSISTEAMSGPRNRMLFTVSVRCASLRKVVKISRNAQRGSGRLGPALLLLVVVLVAAYFVFTRNASVQNAFHSVKESTEDSATTSRVRTALLLSKNVSPFDIKVETTKAEVTLDGQVPTEQTKAVAGAIALDTSGVKEVHNNLSINPSTARNPETQGLSERVADLEIKTLVNQDLSQNAELAEKHIATEVKNRTVTLSGTVGFASDFSTLPGGSPIKQAVLAE